DDSAMAHVESRRTVAGLQVRDRLRISDRAAAARGRSAVVERLPVGVAHEELQSAAEPLRDLELTAVIRRAIPGIALQNIRHVVQRLNQAPGWLRSDARLDL